MDNVIPPMTHELSRYWKQPPREAITLDDTHAMMDQATFDAIPSYTASQPTAVYGGKMWREQFQDGWLLLWFEDREDMPDRCYIMSRIVLIV